MSTVEGEKRQPSNKYTEVHRNTYSKIQGCVWFVTCPSNVAVPCYPIGQYAQPITSRDTVMTGMLEAPLRKKMPVKKTLCTWADEDFSARGEEGFHSRAWKVRRAWNVCELFFLLAGYNIAWWVIDSGYKIATECLDKHLWGKNAHVDVWFSRVWVWLRMHNMRQCSYPIQSL